MSLVLCGHDDLESEHQDVVNKTKAAPNPWLCLAAVLACFKKCSLVPSDEAMTAEPFCPSSFSPVEKPTQYCGKIFCILSASKRSGHVLILTTVPNALL